MRELLRAVKPEAEAEHGYAVLDELGGLGGGAEHGGHHDRDAEPPADAGEGSLRVVEEVVGNDADVSVLAAVAGGGVDVPAELSVVEHTVGEDEERLHEREHHHRVVDPPGSNPLHVQEHLADGVGQQLELFKVHDRLEGENVLRCFVALVSFLTTTDTRGRDRRNQLAQKGREFKG